MSAQKGETPMPATRGRRKAVIGKVTSDKMDKTVAVVIETRVKHPVYGKIRRRWTTLKVHDEKNEAQEGDTVEIMETRPLSRTKRWRLVRIVKRPMKV